MKEYTDELYDNLNYNYSRMVDVNNEFICYINEFISVPRESIKIKINNDEYIVFKAKAKKEDKNDRTYRDIVINKIQTDSNQIDNTIKKVYQNRNGEYYYSYDKQSDRYVCSFDELMWKSPVYYKENVNKEIYESVLTEGLKVYNYSEYFNSIFFNTISNVDEEGKVYFEECKIWQKDNIYLLKEDAVKAYNKRNDSLKESLLYDNYWLSRLRSYLIFDEKMSMKEKEILADIIIRVDRNSIKLMEC